MTNIVTMSVQKQTICKGCRTYARRTSCPWVCIKKSEYNQEELICPCSTCLIKMMCEFSCEELIKHQRRRRSIVYRSYTEGKNST